MTFLQQLHAMLANSPELTEALARFPQFVALVETGFAEADSCKRVVRQLIAAVGEAGERLREGSAEARELLGQAEPTEQMDEDQDFGSTDYLVN